jgi:hypothetical protein
VKKTAALVRPPLWQRMRAGPATKGAKDYRELTGHRKRANEAGNAEIPRSAAKNPNGHPR